MEIDYLNLLGLTLIAVGAPLLDVPRLPVPDAVAMILLGVAVGGSGLGWIEADVAVGLFAELGLAYLLFVAALLTMSIGIVVVVLKDTGRLESPVGQLTLLGALLGDVASAP